MAVFAMAIKAFAFARHHRHGRSRQIWPRRVV